MPGKATKTGTSPIKKVAPWSLKSSSPLFLEDQGAPYSRAFFSAQRPRCTFPTPLPGPGSGRLSLDLFRLPSKADNFRSGRILNYFDFEPTAERAYITG